jgi:hypothetical protein
MDRFSEKLELCNKFDMHSARGNIDNNEQILPLIKRVYTISKQLALPG